MKLLLFDQNISPKLVERLEDIYPHSVHVFNLDMADAMDLEIWEYAREHDFIIVTKDADFSEIGVVKGFPPKVIWIRRGNCSTQDIEDILRVNFEGVKNLSEDKDTGILILF